MKTKEELMALKAEVEEMNNKLAGLTEEELTQVTGGYSYEFALIGTFHCPFCNDKHDFHLFLGCGGYFVRDEWVCKKVARTILNDMSYTGDRNNPYIGTVTVIPWDGSPQCVPYTSRIGL